MDDNFECDGFNWDDGNRHKCQKHGVSIDEIEYVLMHKPLFLPDRYPTDFEARFNAIGRNQKGRFIFIVFTIRDGEDIQLMRPISARYMHRKEIENYERQTEA